MTRTNTRVPILVISVLFALMGLVLFSVTAARFPPRMTQQAESQSPHQQPDKAQRASQQEMERALKEFQVRFPMADYDLPEPSNPGEKAKRRNRNKHYDGKGLVTKNPDNSTSAVIEDSEVFYNLPPLPVAQSDVILTADVLNSQAHLSNDKNAVYSEFNVQVEEVLKGTVPSLSQTNLISVSRLGGVVRYPSGKNVRYEIGHQNMPAIGKRYLFFLKATNDAQAYEIVTGYEIGPQRTLPLDSGVRFEAFSGTDSVVFLNKVRDAIANNN